MIPPPDSLLYSGRLVSSASLHVTGLIACCDSLGRSGLLLLFGPRLLSGFLARRDSRCHLVLIPPFGALNGSGVHSHFGPFKDCGVLMRHDSLSLNGRISFSDSLRWNGRIPFCGSLVNVVIIVSPGSLNGNGRLLGINSLSSFGFAPRLWFASPSWKSTLEWLATCPWVPSETPARLRTVVVLNLSPHSDYVD